jgi:FeS assembly protein IscX
MGLRWTDAREIGMALAAAHPSVRPLEVRFTDLHRLVRDLPEFSDDPERSNEGLLEAIQMAWLDEVDD